MLKNLTPRIYQETILATCAQKNSLVVLPTGLGKTAIAMMLTVLRLKQNPDSKILLLAPTKPLCEQHQTSFRKHMQVENEKIVCFTGSVKPSVREEKWKSARIIISTPQGLENDVINERIDLSEPSLVVFDEAHHATGDYSYVWLAKQYYKANPHGRILALTASPGSEMEKIREVCQNLFVESIEVRSDTDPDVKPYVQETEKNFELLQFPAQFKTLHKLLEDCYNSKLKAVQALGYCNKLGLNKSQVLRLQRELQRELGKERGNFEVMKSLSLVAEGLKVEHALGLLECQGVHPCFSYLKELQEQSGKSKVKAVKNLVRDPLFKAALHSSEKLVEENIVHPKVPRMIELVEEEIARDETSKLLLFTQFRDTAVQIVDALQQQGIRAHVFVGQTKKKGIGMTQKIQKLVLDRFRSGEFTVLVATSVAEEGLDIPRVNKVIFYEPTPSAIRSIQRRGRTGRSEKGDVTVLVTKGTRDEAYRWAAHHKEKRMYHHLNELRKMKDALVFTEKKPQEVHATLDSFASTKVKETSQEKSVTILCDHREKDNAVVKALIDMNNPVRLVQLQSADYVVGSSVGVELKKVDDFVNSLLDGRLLAQVQELCEQFEKPIVIVEGEEDIYSVRRVHPNAIRGALASIAIGFAVPILYTKDSQDTAAFLATMAKREQQKGHSPYAKHSAKPQTSLAEQEFIVESLPLVGPTAAKNLLLHFGSVEKIMVASEKELLEVVGIGKTIAARIRDVLSLQYQKK